MSDSLRSFDRSLPMSLLRAREAVMKKFMPALKAHNLSAQQWRVIRALQADGDMDISELAEACYLLKPSLSRIIQNLESRNIISRSSSSSDQRRSLISLTDVGHQLFVEIAPKSSERYEFISQRFGPGKLELLYELLDELVEKIED
ncbi:homoprotocatechuate degradation operon regulator HpaR [uncultured Pseudoteredinibacter sp.]|uniref:homoprotocatechuate degradation operon regulator HpaR n=1 Tax=uncultured Pseudoteredinibacter sp. TaxID=1641701 RepID=UPI002612C5D4|nr:homoprotocatechuate degradation operon regulator HpaR [uncultured Pseudoteredinibacter sp.]